VTARVERGVARRCTSALRSAILHLSMLAGAVSVAAAALGAQEPAAAARPAISAGHRAAAAELLVVTETERQLREGIASAFDLQVRANPLLGPFRDVMQRYADKYLDWATMQPELVDVYASTFSEPELRDMIAFYRTPTGRRVVRLLPEVTARAQQVAERRVAAHVDELNRMIQQRAVDLQRTPAPKPPPRQ
jgi:uncharacterized protein